jgi:hypothetical protein
MPAQKREGKREGEREIGKEKDRGLIKDKGLRKTSQRALRKKQKLLPNSSRASFSFLSFVLQVAVPATTCELACVRARIAGRMIFRFFLF